MNRILASALAASVLLTGAAQASQLSSDAYRYISKAEVTNLTDQQIDAINGAVSAGDDYNQTRGVIRSIVN